MNIGSTKNQLERVGYNFNGKREEGFVFFTNTDLDTRATVFEMDGHVQYISFTSGFFFRKYSVNSSADLLAAITDYEAEWSRGN